MAVAGKRVAAGKGKKKTQTFVIDCTKPVEDKIMDIANFEKFLLDRIKVDGKTGEPNFPSSFGPFPPRSLGQLPTRVLPQSAPNACEIPLVKIVGMSMVYYSCPFSSIKPYSCKNDSSSSVGVVLRGSCCEAAHPSLVGCLEFGEWW